MLTPWYEEPKAQCYATCMDHMTKGLTLVHGVVHNPDGSCLKHAWLERKNEVIDPTLEVTWPLKQYYWHFRPAYQSRYTWIEAMRMIVEFNTYGPWD